MPKGLPYLKGFVLRLRPESAGRMSAGITSTIRLAIRTLPEHFDRSRITTVIETIEQELYDGGVYANATADSFTIEITVRTTSCSTPPRF